MGGRAVGCLPLTAAVFVSVPHPTPMHLRKITSRSPFLWSWLERWQVVLRFDFTPVVLHCSLLALLGSS